jgi:hypothetical protein
MLPQARSDCANQRSEDLSGGTLPVEWWSKLKRYLIHPVRRSRFMDAGDAGVDGHAGWERCLARPGPDSYRAHPGRRS